MPLTRLNKTVDLYMNQRLACTMTHAPDIITMRFVVCVFFFFMLNVLTPIHFDYRKMGCIMMVTMDATIRTIKRKTSLSFTHKYMQAPSQHRKVPNK